MGNNPENKDAEKVTVITPTGKRDYYVPSAGIVKNILKIGGKLTSVNDHPVVEQTDENVSSYPVLPRQTNKVQ